MDTNVAHHLYTHCVKGLLKDKTRIICTHKSQFLSSSDWVLLMNNGTIINQGRPFEVLCDYDIKTMDVEFDEVNSNMHVSKDDWIPNKEPEIVSDTEIQEDGVVALSVYKHYWNSVGSLTGWLLFIALIIMQVHMQIKYMKSFNLFNFIIFMSAMLININIKPSRLKNNGILTIFKIANN